MTLTPVPEFRSQAQRVAWQEFAKGKTYGQIAVAAGVSDGTVSNWIRKWRREFGDDYGRTDETRKREWGTVAAREASAEKWKELKALEAEKVVKAARRLRKKLEWAIGRYGKEPEDGKPEAKAIDIKHLTAALAQLYKTAADLDAFGGEGRIVEDENDDSAEVVNPLLGARDTPSDLLESLERLQAGFRKEILEAASRPAS